MSTSGERSARMSVSERSVQARKTPNRMITQLWCALNCANSTSRCPELTLSFIQVFELSSLAKKLDFHFFSNYHNTAVI